MTQLRIATINIQRVISEDRISQVINYARSKNLDLVGLQEVLFDRLPAVIKDYKIISNPHSKGGGTAFIYKATLNLSLVAAAADGRIIITKLNELSFVNVYAPSGCLHIKTRKDFYRTVIVPYLSGSKQTVMLGDFNAVTRKIDRRENDIITGKPSEELKDIISAFNFIDVWVNHKASEEGHTRFNKSGSARLDHIYTTNDTIAATSDVQNDKLSFSDHNCLHCVLNVKEILHRHISPKDKVWKLNCAVLTEEEYAERIKYFLTSARKLPTYNHNMCEWWEDTVKPGVKRVTIDYCRQRNQ